MMKAFLFFFLYYIAILAIWIYSVLIPYGRNIIMNIQNHANLNTELDLLYCAKQFLFGLLWTFALAIVAQLLLLLFVRKKY